MNWESIYRENSPGVYQYLLHLSHRRQEAEDLLQETFLRAMGSASPLRQPEKIRPWLLTIARRLFFDAHRREARRDTVDLEIEDLPATHLAGEGDSPEEALLKEDFARQLHRVLTDLPESYQTAFTLAIMQRLTYQEIAEITGWSLAMVKINVFRVRKKVASTLRELLE